MKTLRLLLPLLLATPPAWSADPATLETRHELEAGLVHEHLSNHLADWNSQYLVGVRKQEDGKVIYAGWRATDRFSEKDQEVHVGLSLPATPSFRLQMEGGTSAPHDVLPKHYGELGGQYQLGSGWVAEGAWRTSRYTQGSTRTLRLGLDYYVGNERLGYTLFRGGPSGSGFESSHRLLWSHYYGDRSWIGLSHTRGRETESLGNAGFLTSRVSGSSIAGQHEWTPAWALVWDVGTFDQGDAYTRKGVRLGIRHFF